MHLPLVSAQKVAYFSYEAPVRGGWSQKPVDTVPYGTSLAKVGHYVRSGASFGTALRAAGPPGENAARWAAVKEAPCVTR
jgi:hypothetical protein